MNCPNCNFVWTRLDICPTLPIHDCTKFQGKKLEASGPGQELHKLLKRFGFDFTKDCPCKSHVAEMNRNGPQWCRENIDTIIGWLVSEGEKRKLLNSIFPLWKTIKIVAAKKILRRMVLLAIKKSENAEKLAR